MLDRSDNVGEFVVDDGGLDGEAKQASERTARFLVVAFEDEPPRRFGEGEETAAKDSGPDELQKCHLRMSASGSEFPPSRVTSVRSEQAQVD